MRRYPTKTSSYNVGTNNVGRKITGQLDGDFSAGLTLDVDLAAPTASGISQGTQTLSTTPVDLVTGISQVSETGLGITYTATAAPTVVGGTFESQVVTYTILAE